MVKQLTTLLANAIGRRDVPTRPPRRVTMSSVVRERMSRALRRRLSDRVIDLFQEACIAGDLVTAEELLVVLESMHRRRQATFGDRRFSSQDLNNAREELASRKARRAAVVGATAD